MNVYDQAHGLAQAIKASEEFKQYDAVKKQVDANEELSKMIKDFQAKQLELQTKQMMGETPGSEDMAVIQQLYAIMAKDPIAAQYMEYFRQMEEEFGLKNDIGVSDLAKCPEVLTLEEQQENEEEIWNLLEQAVRGACIKFVETREQEGENLKRDLLLKLDEMLSLVAVVEERSPEIVQEYRQKLEQKVRELLSDSQMDEGRIATEVTIFADKICVDEETVRLKSHIEAMKTALIAGGSIGRKLDFIAQEMNREANTTLSKANDLKLSDCAIDLKTGIEKVREQIQNLE